MRKVTRREFLGLVTGGLTALASSCIYYFPPVPVSSGWVTVTLVIDDGLSLLRVQGRVERGKSLNEVLSLLSERYNLSYETTSFPQLGTFVRSLGALRGGEGRFLVYEVNGCFALGVDQETLQQDTTIYWRLFSADWNPQC